MKTSSSVDWRATRGASWGAVLMLLRVEVDEREGDDAWCWWKERAMVWLPPSKKAPGVEE